MGLIRFKDYHQHEHTHLSGSSRTKLGPHTIFKPPFKDSIKHLGKPCRPLLPPQTNLLDLPLQAEEELELGLEWAWGSLPVIFPDGLGVALGLEMDQGQLIPQAEDPEAQLVLELESLYPADLMLSRAHPPQPQTSPPPPSTPPTQIPPPPAHPRLPPQPNLQEPVDR